MGRRAKRLAHAHLPGLARKQQRLAGVVAATLHIRAGVVAAIACGAPRPWRHLGHHAAMPELLLRRRSGRWPDQGATRRQSEARCCCESACCRSAPSKLVPADIPGVTVGRCGFEMFVTLPHQLVFSLRTHRSSAKQPYVKPLRRCDTLSRRVTTHREGSRWRSNCNRKGVRGCIAYGMHAAHVYTHLISAYTRTPGLLHQRRHTGTNRVAVDKVGHSSEPDWTGTKMLPLKCLPDRWGFASCAEGDGSWPRTFALQLGQSFWHSRSSTALLWHGSQQPVYGAEKQEGAVQCCVTLRLCARAARVVYIARYNRV